MAMTRRRWLLAGLLAAGALLLLAVLGEDRQQSLQRHEASGPLRAIAAERVRAVRIATAERQWRLVRRAGGFAFDAAVPMNAVAARDADARVEAALRLLRNAASERQFDAEVPEFGFAGPQALHVGVEVDGDADYEFVFGVANPIGLARYTRVTHAGHSEAVLMPVYVARAWSQLVGLE